MGSPPRRKNYYAHDSHFSMADDLDVVLDDPVARVPRGHIVFKPLDKPRMSFYGRPLAFSISASPATISVAMVDAKIEDLAS